MPLVFPPSPTDGQIYTFNGRSWRWSEEAGSWLSGGESGIDSQLRKLSIRAIIMGE